jgi:hypothetical protein
MVRYFTLLCLFLFLSELLNAQRTNQNKKSDVIPPSPNVAALGKYGDIPVSPYTGVPSISLPIYEIVSKDISVPISISYHGSGIKVAEESSRVGLGWVLNAGGVISRTIMGPDDFTGAPGVIAYHTTTDLPPDLTVPPKEDYPFRLIQRACVWQFESGFTLDERYSTEDYDFQPDQYAYNFLNYSGKFMLNRNKQVVLAKQEKIDMKLSANETAWHVKTADGMSYVFDKIEMYSQDGEAGAGNHKSAWYLTSITSPQGETVTFKYVTESQYAIKTIGTYSEVKYEANIIITPPQSCGGTPDGPVGGGSMPANQTTYAPRRTYTSVYLTAIDFKNGQVQFAYGTRTDVEGDKKLENIKIYKKLNGIVETTPIKEFTFGYDYFRSVKSPADYIPDGGFVDNLALTRLKLTFLTESVTKNGITQSKSPHIFGYYGDNETMLPGKTSFARDHWGYYNGKTGNRSFVPTYKTGDRNANNNVGDDVVNAAIGQMQDANGIPVLILQSCVCLA